jgi:ribonuclease HII
LQSCSYKNSNEKEILIYKHPSVSLDVFLCYNQKVVNLNKLREKGFEYICGVDEAGRGPLAGPMSLGFFCVSIGEYKNVIKPLLKLGLNDSKKIKENKREEIFKLLSKTHYSNAMLSAKEIDKKGISKCMQILIKKLLKKSQIPNPKTYYLLDGAIKFPKEIFHEVIIKGDSKEPVIMAASIVAKVSRDRKMKLLSKKYPKYNLDINKGYGTLKHRDAIRKFGLSEIHRKSFCKNIYTKFK